MFPIGLNVSPVPIIFLKMFQPPKRQKKVTSTESSSHVEMEALRAKYNLTKNRVSLKMKLLDRTHSF